jgi:ectoine hydroxylase-related dioxygenase (phytanoyl-CoA dioxygenase family)
LAFDPSQRGKATPDSLGKDANWHIFDNRSGLAEVGSVVIMSLRLAHGATANVSEHMRFSWDARFRCRVKDERDVVYGGDPGTR